MAVLPGRRHHEQWQGRQLGGNVHARWRRRTNGVDVPTDDFILLSLHPRRGARRHAPAAELRRGTSCGHGHARRPRSSHAGPAAAPAMRAGRADPGHARRPPGVLHRAVLAGEEKRQEGPKEEVPTPFGRGRSREKGPAPSGRGRSREEGPSGETREGGGAGLPAPSGRGVAGLGCLNG